MSIEVKIHEAQTSILRELLFTREAGYAELQKPTGLSSDHFNFHITRLVSLGLVEKGGRNQWMTVDEARKLEKRYTSFETELDMIVGAKGTFVEETHRYSKDEF